jgi:molybdenum cofactor biosynthesis enzyme MoaA
MSAMMCKACQSAPPASEGLCIVCIRDAQSEARAKEQAKERTRRAKAEAVQRWRPRWRPEVNTGHGHGTLREASERGTR